MVRIKSVNMILPDEPTQRCTFKKTMQDKKSKWKIKGRWKGFLLFVVLLNLINCTSCEMSMMMLGDQVDSQLDTYSEFGANSPADLIPANEVSLMNLTDQNQSLSLNQFFDYSSSYLDDEQDQLSQSTSLSGQDASNPLQIASNSSKTRRQVLSSDLSDWPDYEASLSSFGLNAIPDINNNKQANNNRVLIADHSSWSGSAFKNLQAASNPSLQQIASATITATAIATSSTNKMGPLFSREPPGFIYYLNSSDLVIPCAAIGNPEPTIVSTRKHIKFSLSFSLLL